jgi:membrane fusion protein, multidrug efflux system
MAQLLEKETHQPVRGRNRVLTMVKGAFVLALLAGVAVTAYIVWERLSRVETTDDAQIDGTIVPVSSRIAGSVIAVLAGDQQYVKMGDVLLRLDPRDHEVARARAQADLANAEGNLLAARGGVPLVSTATSSALSGARAAREDAALAVSWAEQQLGGARARLNVAQANVRVAQANQGKAAQDVARYKVLVDKDEIPRQTYDQAVAAETASRATVDAQLAGVAEAQQSIAAAEKSIEQARAKLQQAEAAVEAARVGPAQVKVAEFGVDVASAQVAQRRADFDQATLNLSYTTIAAPVSGIVGRKAVEPGQNIAAGQQLLSIVNLDDIWVTANFKETQLKDMKIGQKVEIDVDANARSYMGTVERISGASGARFSLLPPENATGNYVKVVQRIPVRITIDPGQNNDRALRPGMSVTPKVRIR